jgi:hypothetical protein
VELVLLVLLVFIFIFFSLCIQLVLLQRIVDIYVGALRMVRNSPQDGSKLTIKEVFRPN